MTNTQEPARDSASPAKPTPPRKRDGGHSSATSPDAPPRPNLGYSEISRFHRTDAGNAELFAALFGSTLRYDHTTGQWLVWQKHWFSKDSDNIALRLAKAAARWRGKAAHQLDDREDRDAHYKWAIKSESCPRLEAALKLSQSERPIAERGLNWDADPMLLGVRNGVVNLRTGKLRCGKPSDRILLHSDIAFNPSARCPRWEQFLNEIFGNNKELIDYVQRAMGYCLSGNTSEQVLFLCYGTGANGKSTFLDVLRYACGSYAYNLPFSAFELKARSAIPNEIAALNGKRFITANETNESAELNEGRIKALTGSDPVTARFLYREFFTFEPTGKFWLAFNHKPRVSDDSPGFWRRVRLIPFTQQFPEGKREPGLMEKLKAEAPGILNWAVAGARKWQAKGLKPPEVVLSASEAYRHESDLLMDFITERCNLDTKARTTAAAMWKEYISWAEASGERALDRRSFSQRLESHGFKKVRLGHNRTWTWIEIALRPEAPGPSIPALVRRADADVSLPLLTN
jgi:putative DNA primase/helicase